jgi:hypothetical protein
MGWQLEILAGYATLSTGGLIMAWHDFLTGGAFKTIEAIALEWIDTDKESAEAKVLKLKALDPNGKMRRDQSTMLLRLYAGYFTIMGLLIVLEFFGLGEATQMATATGKLKELFTPITTLVGIIISASFGVNYANTKQNK